MLFVVMLDHKQHDILCLQHHPNTPEQEDIRMLSSNLSWVFNTVIFYLFYLSQLGLKALQLAKNISNTNTLNAGMCVQPTDSVTACISSSSRGSGQVQRQVTVEYNEAHLDQTPLN